MPPTPPTTPLTDGVITLRQRTESDVDAIAEASHDPETRRWLTDPPLDAGPLLDEEARRHSLARTREAWRTGTATPFVIADARTDEPAGLVNLQFHPDSDATVAYSVFPGFRGRGIAPRAVELISGWAFAGLGLDRLVLEADVENKASRRVAEKCGFEQVEVRTVTDPTGKVCTTVVFQRTAPE